MNSIVIKGRLTAKPQVRTTPSGKNVASFTLAVDSGYGNSKKTDFFRCSAWEKKADFCEQYFDKGNWMLVLGEMHSTQKDDKTYWEVTAQQIEFCGEKAKTEITVNKVEETEDFSPIADEAGDLPF